MRATILLAVTIGALTGAYAASLSANDPDLFWHLASGKWMLDHGQILGQDPFSFTMAGTTYSAGQWLGEILYALVHRVGGWPGIDLLRGALVGLAAFFAARVTLRFQPHPGWAIGPLIGALLVSTLMWGDRPQLFSLALFPAVLDVLLAVRLDAARQRLWALVPVAFLWAWLHGAFVLGLAVLLIFVIEAWISGNGQRRALTLTFFLSLVASQLTPAGPLAFLSAASYAGSTSAVAEERPLTIASGAGLVFFLLLLAVVGSALLVDRVESRRRLGSPLLFAMLIPSLTLVGLLHQRNIPYAAMVLAPVAAVLVPLALRRPVGIAPIVQPRLALALSAAIVVAALAVGAAVAPAKPDLSRYPAGALAPLRDVSGNLFHEYDWGGFLILELPEHPTYVDGRGATLFPAALIQEFQDTVALRPGYSDVLRSRDIRLVLVRPERALAVALQEQGWQVLGREPQWVLLARP